MTELATFVLRPAFEPVSRRVRINAFAAAVRFGFYEFRAAHPFKIWLTTVVPRVTASAALWVLIGQLTRGDAGREYNFVGAVVMALSVFSIGGMTDAPITDKWMGTQPIMNRSVLRPATIYLGRSVAQWAFALIDMAMCWLLVGIVTGNGRLALQLLPAVWVLLIISVSMACTGFWCGAFCLGKRAEVIFYNVLMMLILACSGAYLPQGRWVVLDTVGQILPATHGLKVARGIAFGEPWSLWSIAAEVAVGASWLAAGFVVHRRLARRGRLTGHNALA